MPSSFFVNNGGSTAARTTITDDLTASEAAKSDAQKLALNAEDAQFTLSDGVTTGNSALHYNAKANASATSAAGSALTATQQAGLANDAKLAAQTAKAEAVIGLSNTVQLTGDQTIAGAKTFTSGIDVTGTVTADGVSLGDADQIQIGDKVGGDLKIYHSGGHSFIEDVGTGNLVIRGQHVEIKDSSNKEKVYVADGASGAVQLYYGHDTPAKLTTTAAGIDVTGTVTGLNFKHDNSDVTPLSWSSFARNGTASVLYVQQGASNVDIATFRKDSTEAGQGNEVLGVRSTGIDVTGTVTADGLTVDGDLTTSGNVGIGTSSPSSFWSGGNQLVVGSGTGSQGLTIYSGTTSDAGIYFSDGTAGNALYQGQIFYRHTDDAMVFNTAATERMRIDSSGNLLVGGTVPAKSLEANGSLIVRPTLTGSVQTLMQMLNNLNTSGTGGKSYIDFYNGNATEIGSISGNASSITYATSSDYRLKTDAQPMTGATARVQALNPVNFEWISNGTRVDGFLAHEAQEVVPEAVTGTKDAMKDEEYEVTPAVLDADDNVVTAAVMGTRSVPDYQGIDQAKLVPLLVATIQELEARITALES